MTEVCGQFADCAVRKLTRREIEVCGFFEFADDLARAHEGNFGMSRALTGDDIRNTYQSRVNWGERVRGFLAAHGPATTRQVYLDGLSGGLRYDVVVELLAVLVEGGGLVATRTVPGRNGRPGTVYSLAKADDGD